MGSPKQQPLVSNWVKKEVFDPRKTVFAVFRAKYRDKYGYPYLGISAADATIAKGVGESALIMADEEVKLREVPADAPPLRAELATDVIEHWVTSYLAEDGYYLEHNRHPLRCLSRDLQKYGLPASWKMMGEKKEPGYRDLNDYIPAREPDAT